MFQITLAPQSSAEMSRDHLFDRNNYDDYNFYDSEDLLNEGFENDYDFYETDYDATNDFKTSPKLKDAYETSKSSGNFAVPPPLPLCHFDKETADDMGARTITGRSMRHIDHHSRPSEALMDALHNPMICR